MKESCSKLRSNLTIKKVYLNKHLWFNIFEAIHFISLKNGFTKLKTKIKNVAVRKKSDFLTTVIFKLIMFAYPNLGEAKPVKVFSNEKKYSYPIRVLCF